MGASHQQAQVTDAHALAANGDPGTIPLFSQSVPAGYGH